MTNSPTSATKILIICTLAWVGSVYALSNYGSPDVRYMMCGLFGGSKCERLLQSQ